MQRKVDKGVFMANQEFDSKQRMLLDWEMVRNAILWADSGEMKVTHHKNNVPGGGVVGITVELNLGFDDAKPDNFTKDQKAAIDKAKKDLEEASK